MLVLSRKESESIVIGDGAVVITVVSICGDQIRLGVTAPPEVPVHRHELWNRLERERLDRERGGGAA
jgi:carbon storage regulator